MEELKEDEAIVINGGTVDKQRDNLDAAAELIGGAVGGVVGFIAALF